LHEHIIQDVPWTSAKLPVNTFPTNLLFLILKDCILLPQLKTMKLKQERHHTHPTLHVKHEAVPLLPFSHNLSPSPNPTHLKLNPNSNPNPSQNKTSPHNSSLPKTIKEMCFGKNDLRGEAPSGLNGDEKPPRISSHSSLSQDRSALPRSGKKNKLSAGDGELGESYEFVFPLFIFLFFIFCGAV